ncbi:alg7 dolichyl-phosphate N-acetylglucosaminephosphotransferase isoform 2-T2 [Cochliomyia hominivorax]
MHLRLSSTLHNGRDLSDNSKEIMQLLKPVMTTNINQQVHQLQNHHNHNHHHHHHQHHHQQQQTHTKGTWTKRFILWSILLIQFGFILCFWLMQLGLSDKLNETTNPKHHVWEENRINFIQTAAVALKSTKKLTSDVDNMLEGVSNFQWPSRDLKFQHEFLLHQSNFNLSEAEKIMFGETSLWCFKEGTANDTRLKGIEWNDSNPWQENCECLPEWHGRDCGQPEVIWRALLTAKTPFKVKDPTREEAHRLIYLLEGYFLNIDLMELQIKAVSKVVDYFIVYVKRYPINNQELKSIKFRLKQMLPMKNYFLYHCKLPSYNNCSSAEAYRLFRQQQLPTNAIKPSDIFIFTDDKTILGHRALNFLKYYGSDVAFNIQFRLKFVVYGFFWQHSQQTHLSGLISSFQNIDNADANPSLLLKQITSQQQHQQQQQQPSLVIGDLNHFGGWYCKYCQEPEEIINELQLLQSSTNTTLSASSSSLQQYPKSIENSVVLPMDKKHSSPHIDAAYVQQLISTGIYLKDDIPLRYLLAIHFVILLA